MSKVKRLIIDAMLSALCVLLGYYSVDMGFNKLTLESFPVLVAGFLLGPLDGFAVGFVGTFCSQLLKYGISVTTPIWIFPHAFCGWAIGFYAKKCGFSREFKKVLPGVIAHEVLVTVLNTGAIWADAVIFGYYSKAYVFGSLAIRLAVSVGKAIVFGIALPPLLETVFKGTKRIRTERNRS